MASQKPLSNLPDHDVEAALAGLEGWSREGKALVRTFAFDSFADAIAFVNRVAEVAERADHHPDIDVRYTRVRVATWTHVTDGVTKRDVDLARAVSAASG